MTNEPQKDVPVDAQQSTDGQNIGTEKKRRSPLRLVCLLLVLCGAVVMYFMETRAKGPYEESVAALQAKMPEKVTPETEQQHVGLYRPDLEKLLVGDPVRDFDAGRLTEIITWQGVFKSYRIELRYARGEYVTKLHTETTWRWEE